MTVKPGMLPGDEFSFEEWKAAQGKPRIAPVLLPADVQNALNDLRKACDQHHVPYVVIMAMQGGDHLSYDLMSNPETISHQMLLARSAVVDDQPHKLALMAHSLQSLDLSKFKL